MRFAMHRARARLFLPACLILPFAGCVAAPPIVATPSACSTLIADSWRVPVPGAGLPGAEATVGDWIAFGDAQTGQLDKANGRTADTIGIISRCEGRDAAAVKQARPKILGIF